jgi:Type I phosphodiesterase / nucleotide pyrophosphatase
VSHRKLVALLVVLVAVVAAPAQASHRERPSRVLLIMLDQARPDTIERYGMERVQQLIDEGKSFPKALVGHMAAETVISHNVITSGQFPRNMGWSNEVHRDVDGVLGTAGEYYVTSSMSCAQFRDLIEAGGYLKLPDYLDAEFGESSKFVSIAQKRTAVCPAGQTSSAADGTQADPEDFLFQIRGSASPTACDPSYHNDTNWRQPEFVSGTPAPAYLGLAFPCSRWSTWQAAGAYGTNAIRPGAIYPLDGDRFVPGRDDLHVGGDNWSADAAIRVIEADPAWRGMLVSLGAIDKLGHMWGPEDDVTGPPGSDLEISHLPFAAKNADAQVGRIVDALEAKGIRDETLIVITADHAAQTGDPFFGRLDGPITPSGIPCDPVNGSSGLRSDCNWYYGQDGNETYRDPSPAVAALRNELTPAGGDPVADTNLRFAYQDGHVAAWLKDNSADAKREAAAAVLDMPGVIASFHLNGAEDNYDLFGTNNPTGQERAWFARFGEQLVDTMAAPFGPDVVGLLETDVTYGVLGDHGGHQELVQSIPMIFSGPGIGSTDSQKRIRLVDVLPTVLDAMGIAYDESSLDGEAVRIFHRQR